MYRNDCIVPTIQQTKSAIDSVNTDLNTYKTQDGTVSGEGTLDEDLLNQKLSTLESSKTTTESTISDLSSQIATLQLMPDPSSATVSYINQLINQQSDLQNMMNTMKYGNPPKSFTDHTKSGIKKFVKDPVSTIGGLAKWVFGG